MGGEVVTRLLAPLALAAALAALPARAQSGSAPPDAVNGIMLTSIALPSLTFGVLTSVGIFGDAPPRKGFVINGIVFGAIALTYGAIFLGLNAGDPRQRVGWVAASAGALCIGAVVTGLSLFELISMKRDGSWEGTPAPRPPAAPAPPPAVEQPPEPPPPPVFPTLGPTPDGRGITFALVGRLP